MSWFKISQIILILKNDLYSVGAYRFLRESERELAGSSRLGLLARFLGFLGSYILVVESRFLLEGGSKSQIGKGPAKKLVNSTLVAAYPSPIRAQQLTIHA